MRPNKATRLRGKAPQKEDQTMTIKTVLSTLAIALLGTACSLQGGDGKADKDPVCVDCDEDDAGPEPTPDAGVDTDAGPQADAGNDNPVTTGTVCDPVRSPKARTLDFCSDFTSGSTKGEVRGTLPMMTWTKGLVITDASPSDDYAYMGITMDFNLPAGTYDISYIGYQGETVPATAAEENWADYGLKKTIQRMSSEGRAFIQCNWYDATSKKEITVAKPECHIRITADANGVLTGAGNMKDAVL